MDVENIIKPFKDYYDNTDFCYCNLNGSDDSFHFSWDEGCYGHITLDFDFKYNEYTVLCIMPIEDYCQIFNLEVTDVDRVDLSNWNETIVFEDPYRAFDEFNRLITNINDASGGKLSDEVLKLIHTNIT